MAYTKKCLVSCSWKEFQCGVRWYKLLGQKRLYSKHLIKRTDLYENLLVCRSIVKKRIHSGAWISKIFPIPRFHQCSERYIGLSLSCVILQVIERGLCLSTEDIGSGKPLTTLPTWNPQVTRCEERSSDCDNRYPHSEIMYV